MEFMTDQKKFKWYANAQGDCDHALRVKGNSKAYEIGIVKNPEAEGYKLLSDFYAGGKGLEACVGKNGSLLNQNYSAKVAIKQARRDGYRVKQTTKKNGNILLRLSQ